MTRPRPPIEPTEDIISRFVRKVEICESGCWEWRGSKGPKGYGYFQIGSASYRAHRVAYELETGNCPGSLLVCHSCDNPSCVNPRHLWLGTTQDNIDDKMAKGRWSNGASPLADGAVRTCKACGHKRTDDYVDRHGVRRCRPCHVRADQRRRAKQKRKLGAV